MLLSKAEKLILVAGEAETKRIHSGVARKIAIGGIYLKKKGAISFVSQSATPTVHDTVI
ncbi:hypothetical protein KDK_63240 [Dictyobacter kobayashii]|uniref:Uncharacterized protein n=1 Tax=Dictyobacter kobayashii TaxID=2014872 RepID=A0A402ATW0_9CHLR|nr:hypothetical protein KDK_63240 [Dictyobacter kobayashii]